MTSANSVNEVRYLLQVVEYANRDPALIHNLRLSYTKRFRDKRTNLFEKYSTLGPIVRMIA